MKTDIHKEILELTKEWQKALYEQNGVHKDRDCHWHIETCWSYGQEPDYYVYHYGYIAGDQRIACDSYETALEELKKVLQKCINEQKNL